MEKILFATGNKGKVEEMQPLFQERGFELEQVEVDIAEIDALDVEDVARRKAVDSYEALEGDGPVLVEDTGIFVEALGGFPGAKAAFFSRTVGVEGLPKLLKGADDRSAYFKTAIAFHDGDSTKVVSGKVEGEIAREKRGKPHEHLPYDSYFIPSHGSKTYAEEPELKEEFSHRRQATEKFLEWLEG